MKALQDEDLLRGERDGGSKVPVPWLYTGFSIPSPLFSSSDPAYMVDPVGIRGEGSSEIASFAPVIAVVPCKEMEEKRSSPKCPIAPVKVVFPDALSPATPMAKMQGGRAMTSLKFPGSCPQLHRNEI